MIEEQKKWKQQQTFFRSLSIDLLREKTLRLLKTWQMQFLLLLHLFAVCHLFDDTVITTQIFSFFPLNCKFLQRAFRNVVCVSNVKLWPNFVLLLHFEMKRTQVLYVIYLRFATILPPLFPTEKKTSVIILPRCCNNAPESYLKWIP